MELRHVESKYFLSWKVLKNILCHKIFFRLELHMNFEYIWLECITNYDYVMFVK